jgi:hypothetical protein
MITWQGTHRYDQSDSFPWPFGTRWLRQLELQALNWIHRGYSSFSRKYEIYFSSSGKRICIDRKQLNYMFHLYFVLFLTLRFERSWSLVSYFFWIWKKVVRKKKHQWKYVSQQWKIKFYNVNMLNENKHVI